MCVWCAEAFFILFIIFSIACFIRLACYLIQFKLKAIIKFAKIIQKKSDEKKNVCTKFEGVFMMAILKYVHN